MPHGERGARLRLRRLCLFALVTHLAYLQVQGQFLRSNDGGNATTVPINKSAEDKREFISGPTRLDTVSGGDRLPIEATSPTLKETVNGVTFDTPKLPAALDIAMTAKVNGSVRFELPKVVEEPPAFDDDQLENGFSIDRVSVKGLWTTLQDHQPRILKSKSFREFPTSVPPEGYQIEEPYHWSGLIGQSLFFNVVENSFRAASDDQIRILLAKKPFWHDYFASVKQFNMGRWNDGDDFLVNYVGHSMQGAVSGFIEIQNDPVGRQQEISATHMYWKSRFKAFLWATVYSTHSEISPLGEAGIGNEGGWTYPINCAKGCTNFNPTQ